MSLLQCPVCFSPLEVRNVTPCDFCGGWPKAVDKFDSTSTFSEFRLPDDSLLVLCNACVLEEFLVPHGFGYMLFPDSNHPLDELRLVKRLDNMQLRQDKYCSTCNSRFSFLKLSSKSN
jgi:hypothetical protein